MDIDIRLPVNGIVCPHDLRYLLRNSRDGFGIHIVFFRKYGHGNAIKCLRIQIACNLFREFLFGVASSEISQHFKHLLEIFLFRKNSILEFFQDSIDSFREAIVKGRVFIAVQLYAFCKVRYNRIGLRPVRRQLVNNLVEIADIHDINRFVDLLYILHRHVSIQQVSHLRFVFRIIERIGIADFHAAANLREKHEGIAEHFDFSAFERGKCLHGVHHHRKSAAKCAECIVKFGTDFCICQKDFNLFRIFPVLDWCKNVPELRIRLAEASHASHDIDNDTLDVRRIVIFKSSTAIHFHGGVQLAN